MKSMAFGGESKCPFNINTDPATFKVGDQVAYRVPELGSDMPFVGVLLEVYDDYVILQHLDAPKGDDHPMRGTREESPVVSKKEALGEA